MFRLKQAIGVYMLVSALLPALAAQAATYYVATNGSDRNTGTSEDTPFRTVAKCTFGLVAGDTCYVMNGTYVETGTVYIRASGTATAPIKLMAYSGHTPVVKFNDDNPSAPKYLGILLQITPGHNKPIAYIHIEGLIIESGRGLKWHNCSNCVIRRNWFKNPYGSCIYGFGAIDTVIDRNLFTDCGDPVGGGHGMYIGGSRYVITNNIIQGQEHYGIQFRGNWNPNNTIDWATPEFGKAENAIVRNNVFAYGRGGAGIVIYGSLVSNAKIENNIFYQNTQTSQTYSTAQGIEWVSCCSSGIQIKNNIFYATAPRNTLWISTQPREGVHYTQSGNMINTSLPGFVNAPATLPASPNFKLNERSPALDKGLPPEQSPALDKGLDLTTTGVDFDGTTRPQGRAYDIGAYEYSAGNDAQAPAAPLLQVH